MKKVAIILSGCGVMDGSEIHEAVLTMLALDNAGAAYECLAPDAPQRRVVNHLTNDEDIQDTRNILQESARIARGHIKNIKEARVSDFDAAIFPGGYGAALNLCDFGLKGMTDQVQLDVLRFAKEMANAKKPQGFMCIAPVLIAQIYGKGVKVTIGTDESTSKAMNAMGNMHVPAAVNEAVVDEIFKVVTTPAYMLGKSIREVSSGIEKLVHHVLQMA